MSEQGSKGDWRFPTREELLAVFGHAGTAEGSLCRVSNSEWARLRAQFSRPILPGLTLRPLRETRS